MASIIINCSQNIEDQYFDKFGLPMILCNSHQNSVCEFINLNIQNHNKLVCAQCVFNDRLNLECLISVKELFSKNPNNIIQNWPPMQDLNIYKQLKNNSVQESKKSQSIEQIDNYFDKLKVDILKIIDEHHKKILVHINSIEENRQKVIDIYNEISNTDEIKNEILKNKDNQQQLEQYLKQIISKLQSQSQQNQQTINIALNLFTKYEQQYQFDFIEEVLNKYLKDLKSIDILKPVNLIEQEFSSQILKKKKDQDKENKQSLKFGQMLEKNEENEQKKDINEIDLLQSLKIIKSNNDNQDQISFKQIENKYFLIEKSGQVIIEQEINRENKYQIEIEIKENYNNKIIVGLLPISQKDYPGYQSKLSLFLFKSGYGIDLIESGKHISEFGIYVQQISFQISLKEKILRCLSVVNNVQNINSLDDWNKIQENEKYYFYIALAGSSSVQITQFKIIKQFDQW